MGQIPSTVADRLAQQRDVRDMLQWFRNERPESPHGQRLLEQYRRHVRRLAVLVHPQTGPDLDAQVAILIEQDAARTSYTTFGPQRRDAHEPGSTRLCRYVTVHPKSPPVALPSRERPV